MSRTLGQRRAEYCLQKLENLGCDRDEFKKLTAGLPAMILQNGFGQTLAFLLAKSGDKHIAAFEIIVGWLEINNILPEGNKKIKLQAISRMPQSKYLHAQRESLAMLEWLKRYANAALFEGQS